MFREREKLLGLLVQHSLHFKETFLSSGKISNYYIDGKMVAFLPEGAPLISKTIKEIIGDAKIDAVGGLTLGADPMLGALSGKGYFRTFIVRKQPKEYGLNKWIEGQLSNEDERVVIIDDVATTGGSILTAIKTVKKEFPNIEIVKVIVLVDREEGAREKLFQHGYVLESVFKSKELIDKKVKCFTSSRAANCC